MLRFIPYLLLLVCAVSCVPQEEPEPEKTQLEIRECQTRTFEVNNYSGVMKSVLDVLQDDGFMVRNVSSDLGFLSATKEIGLNERYSASRDNDTTFDLASDMGFGFSVGRGFGVSGSSPRRNARYPTHKCIEATINVSKFGNQVRVRASFQSKVFDTNDAVMRVEQITDDVFYQDFFAKVDKGIFIYQQDI
jgi:hypothetical protein